MSNIPEQNKKRVGYLTTFYNFDPSYSLCSVVQAQLVPLVKYGYKPVLFVLTNFSDDIKVPIGVEIRKIVPQFLLTDYSAHQEASPELEIQAKQVYEALKEHTKDIDIMFEADLIFQGWFLPYCMGIHKFAAESKIKWFHWVHSFPNQQPAGLLHPHTLRYTLPENSKLVYLNNVHMLHAAEAYHLFPKDVRIVYNSIDPRLFWNLDPFVVSLIDKYDLLSADFMQVYPVSTPRMVAGKGLYVIIDILAALKRMGKKVRLVVCNAHANDKREKQVIAEAVSYASQKGLSQLEVIYTSLEGVNYELGVSRSIVSELFRLSNLFIFPSSSENCSLILLEAMLSKCLLVLNESVAPMREFGKENALYFKFGSIHENVNYSNKDTYYGDIAKIIVSEFSQNKALKANNDIKQHYNFEMIFRTQIEPLIYEQ